jgi:hypothetical protein
MHIVMQLSELGTPRQDLATFERVLLPRPRNEAEIANPSSYISYPNTIRYKGKRYEVSLGACNGYGYVFLDAMQAKVAGFTV